MIKKLLSLKRILKNYKHSIRAIFEVKIILMKMACKIIKYFCQYSGILERVQLPMLLIMSYHGNLKAYLTKLLKHLAHLIIVLRPQ